MKFIAAAWRHRAAEVFGIDLRTLALFRAALGALLVFYAFNRLPDATAFFTDWGVLPRAYQIQTEGWSRLSLYFINGESWFAWLLLLLTAAGGLALLAGYRTRAATVLLFVLFTSLINRNPMITIGGDTLLCCLLFWAMFLPLGARWSMDAALSTRPPPEKNLHVSFASAGLILQVLSVYFFSALLKNAADWLPDGTAVYYTMEVERYASPLGRDYLRHYPGLMQALTYYVWFLELLGPLLALSPWFRRPLRFAVMLMLMGMHVGFILFMEIGYFPFVSLASHTVLLGGWFWDWRRRANEAAHPVGPKIYYDRDCGFCRKTCLLFREFLILPRAQIAPAQNSQRAGALLEAHYSWVVIDADDRAYLKWAAFVVLLKHSPLFRWLWWLARWSRLEPIGDAVYDFVGRHRGRAGALTARLFRDREVRFETGRWAQGIAAVFVAMVLVWNLVTIQWISAASVVAMTPVFRLARIDQIWNMFAPFPSRLDGWPVYPGRLEDGTEVDVLRPGQPLSWERPRYLSQAYPNVAWHTYRWRITQKPHAGHMLYYGKYLCREWNWSAQPGKRLATFEMTYVEEYSPPPGESATLERRIVWRHDCRPKEGNELQRQRDEKRRDPLADDRRRPV
jgi:predicted DCC family thiol-disulfide oxidoreductase YuxK